MYTSTIQNHTDQQLVESFQATADKFYFGIIYQRYHEKVYRCCLSILKDRSRTDDLTQDIMLIVLDKLPQLRNGNLLSFWIYRISRNEAVKAARANAHRRTDNIDTKGHYAAEADGKAELLEHELELALVRNALRELKPLDRQIIEQKYLREASISDLQENTGLSASAIKMRLLRARGQLLGIFQEKSLLGGNAA